MLMVTSPTLDLSRLGHLALVKQPVLKKENCEFTPASLGLEIYLVLHSAHSEWVG